MESKTETLQEETIEVGRSPFEQILHKTEFEDLKQAPEGQKFIDHVSKCRKTDPKKSKVSDYINLLKRVENSLKMIEGAIMLRKVLKLYKIEEIVIQKILDSGAVPLIISHAKTAKELVLRVELVWCLSNMTAGNNTQISDLVKIGLIDLFLEILKEDDLLLASQALWGVNNISYLDVTYRDKFLAGGAIGLILGLHDKLVGLRPSEGVSLAGENVYVCQMIESISNLFRFSPLPSGPKIKQIFPKFSNLLLKMTETSDLTSEWDFRVIFYCVITFSKIVAHKEDNEDFGELIHNLDLTKPILDLLNQQITHPNTRMFQSACLKILGAFTLISNESCQKIVDLGGLEVFTTLLHSKIKKTRREVGWILSNIAVGTKPQIQSILNNKPLLRRLMTMSTEDEDDVRLEAIWTICNLTLRSSEQQLYFLLRENFMELCLNVLSANIGKKILGVVLESICTVMKRLDGFGGGSCVEGEANPLVDKIVRIGMDGVVEGLTLHEDYTVRKNAEYVLGRCRGSEDGFGLGASFEDDLRHLL